MTTRPLFTNLALIAMLAGEDVCPDCHGRGRSCRTCNGRGIPHAPILADYAALGDRGEYKATREITKHPTTDEVIARWWGAREREARS